MLTDVRQLTTQEGPPPKAAPAPGVSSPPILEPQVIAIYHACLPHAEASRLADLLAREGFPGQVVIALDDTAPVPLTYRPPSYEGRAPFHIQLSNSHRDTLHDIVNHPPHRWAERKARVLLLASTGTVSVERIAAEVGVGMTMVRQVCRRYQMHGLAVIYARRGRKAKQEVRTHA